MRGANAVKMRSTILRLWSEVVMAGAGAGAGDTVEAITMNQALPGEVQELEIFIHQFIHRI